MPVEVRKVVFYTESQPGQLSNEKLRDAILVALERNDFLRRFNHSTVEGAKLRRPPYVTWSDRQ